MGFCPPHHLSLSSSNCKARKQQSHRWKYSQSLNHVLERYPSTPPTPRGFPHSSVGKESACNAGDPGLIPGSGRSAGEGISYLIQLFDLVVELPTTPVFLGLPCDSAGKEFTYNTGDLGLIPRLGRSPGEGKGYPLQYSGLENSMGCIVHGVAKSQTGLGTHKKY